MNDKDIINYNKILKKFSIGTIQKLFELENNKCSEFVLKGVCYIISHSLNLVVGDSDGRSYLDRFTNERMASIYSTIEWTANIVDYKENKLKPDFIIIKLLQQEINVLSSKVICLEINKKLF
jgi:hypothetical protein